ncbi:MAG: hypothetical protein JRJ21_00260 [Deltaproteobacteria bacterium]|nr:hypothetical protein [Deltaproteobacteria bacterium]
MDQYGKMVRMALIVLFCTLIYPAVVCAQPFGIMSKKGAQESQQQILSSSNGRFVFGQISNSGKDKFMLDTATGRLWRIGKTGAVGLFLKSVPYRDDKGTCSMLPGPVTPSKAKKKAGKK